MEVYTTSTEYIKPSSPTPQHLRTHNLSLLDQFAPPVYIPMVLYYPMDQLGQGSITNTNNKTAAIITKRSKLLKESLSQTLTLFYPLAGRIKDNVSVDCNDQGAYYVEALTDSHLAHFLSQPDLSLISKFVQSPTTWDGHSAGAPIVMIQVTVFACGGIVIGATISHMVLDAPSTSFFLKAWAAHANSAVVGNLPTPTFDAASVFPPNPAYPRDATHAGLLRPIFRIGKSATRRFLFDASAMAKLKTKAAISRSSVQNPTRVEVVSALIWKCAMAAFKVKYSGLPTPSLVANAVNMRQRAVPQLPECFMGNLFWLAPTLILADHHKKRDDDQLFSYLVCQLREAKMKINEEFVTNFKGDGGFEHLVTVVKNDAKAFNAVESCGDGIGFTSLRGSGFYHIDFGWGKPAWISSLGSPGFECRFANIVALLDTRLGDGIEAWVTLDEQVLAILEQDHQLLAFASVDPSPALDQS